MKKESGRERKSEKDRRDWMIRFQLKVDSCPRFQYLTGVPYSERCPSQTQYLPVASRDCQVKTQPANHNSAMNQLQSEPENSYYSVYKDKGIIEFWEDLKTWKSQVQFATIWWWTEYYGFYVSPQECTLGRIVFIVCTSRIRVSRAFLFWQFTVVVHFVFTHLRQVCPATFTRLIYQKASVQFDSGNTK